MEPRDNKSEQVVTLQQDLQTNKEQPQLVRRQLQDLNEGTTEVERDAVIVVDKNNAAAGKVRLNYLVSAASWRPQYKFRAGKSEKEAVQLEYLAAIIQQTGEDWTTVNMTLSTAQPMLNAAPPDLRVLAVAVIPRGAPNDPMATSKPAAQGQAMQYAEQAKKFRMDAQQEFVKRNPTAANDNFNNAAALEATRELLWATRDEVIAHVKGGNPIRNSAEEGPSVTYHLPTKLSVPSRHDEQVIEVTKIDMVPEYFYKAVPVLT